MKKFLILAAVFLVAVFGFLAGRMTAPPSLPIMEDPIAEEHVIPEAFPEPPETTPYVAATPDEEDEQGLIVESPAEQSAANGPFDLSGRALAGSLIKAELRRASDREVVWTGEYLVEKMSDSEFGRFDMTVEPPLDEAEGYVLEVSRLQGDGHEGVETVTRDVAVGIADAVKVKVFFSKIEYGGLGDCSDVTAVSRVVSSNDPVYRATVEELLRGPTEAERSEGFMTSLPEGVVLKSVAADASGTVIADFSSSLNRQVAGSCLVTTIRSQISETLMQFPEVREVIIAVEGRFEDVLQP